MKHIFKPLIFLVFLFSYMGSAAYGALPPPIQGQSESHLEVEDIAIEGEAIYVLFREDWVKVQALRSDEGGIFVLQDDIMPCGGRIVKFPKKWKCPYCHHWNKLGERCTYQDCPTNHFDKKKSEE